MCTHYVDVAFRALVARTTIWRWWEKRRTPGLPRPRRSWKKEEKIRLYYTAIEDMVLYAHHTIDLR